MFLVGNFTNKFILTKKLILLFIYTNLKDITNCIRNGAKMVVILKNMKKMAEKKETFGRFNSLDGCHA